MRQKLLAFLCAALMLTAAAPMAAAQGDEWSRAADTLHTLNLVQGEADGSYGLDRVPTRAQAVTVIVRLAAAETAAQSTDWIAGFRDVPAWAADTVNYAARQGWAAGVNATTFAPDSPVTADAYCTFLLRMLGYSDKNGDFEPAEAAEYARLIGLTNRAYPGTFTRGDLFELTAGALTFAYKGGTETVIDRLVSAGVSPAAAANALGLTPSPLTSRQVADRLTAAVVQLDNYQTDQQVREKTPVSNASAFFITADGLAVTNFHALIGNTFSFATTVTGQTYPVERVVYYDRGIDIAVIRISKTAVSGRTVSEFSHLDMAGTDTVRNGDQVFTISNPLGLGLSVSTGIISNREQPVERYTLPCIQNTADISQGSSGGVLMNAYGQAIGVTSGAFLYGNGMYLAVPIDPILGADLTAAGWTLEELVKLEPAAEEE